jgi:breast cancer 2 susceptibility protein
MVLCISDLIWSEDRPLEDRPVPPTGLQLEVTDGWYRLRAEVDQPLIRAIERNKLRIGMKIVVSGARVRTCCLHLLS